VAQPTPQYYYYWVGCWKEDPTDFCRDVFAYPGNTRDLWVCYPCGRMVTPEGHTCFRYPASTLYQTGEWCDWIRHRTERRI